MSQARHGDPRGAVLLDALAGLALLGLLAAGVLSLAHGAVHLARDGAELDAGRRAAEGTLAEFDALSWQALPAFFGAAPGDGVARLDTGDGTAPSAWRDRAARQGVARIEAELIGLRAGGGTAAFEDAVALRIEVRVYGAGRSARHPVTIAAWRF